MLILWLIYKGVHAMTNACVHDYDERAWLKINVRAAFRDAESTMAKSLGWTYNQVPRSYRGLSMGISVHGMNRTGHTVHFGIFPEFAPSSLVRKSYKRMSAVGHECPAPIVV